jgi:hypothetical protein
VSQSTGRRGGLIRILRALTWPVRRLIAWLTEPVDRSWPVAGVSDLGEDPDFNRLLNRQISTTLKGGPW